jgi:hypothetical protein
MSQSYDWFQEQDEDKYEGFVLKPKCVIFDPLKKRSSVSHYLTIEDLRVKSDIELDMTRKSLFKKGKYVIEEGEIFE